MRICRNRSSIWLGVGLLCSSPLSAAPPGHAATIQVRLDEEGKDVTKANTDAVALFYNGARGVQEGSQTDVVRCAVGTPCDLPPGEYVPEVESETIVLDTRPLVFVPKDATLTLLLTLHVTPAAFIEIPGAKLPAGAYLTAIDEKTGSLHSRKIDGPVARVRIPGRQVILCGFEAGAKPIGCQRVQGRAGETSRLSGFLQPAKGRGQLLVGLMYPAREPAWDAAIALRIGEKTLPPDVVTARFTHFYAVWFDAPAGQGTLEVTSKFWTTDSAATIEVPERRTAVQMKIPLIRKPALRVTLDGGSALGAGTLTMDLFTCERHMEFDQLPALPLCALAASQNGTSTQTFTFQDLSAAAYAVRWRKASFESTAWIDMRDGRSRDEKLPVDLMKVSGRVTLRGRGVAARIRWEAYNSGAHNETQSDDDGNYSLILAQKGMHFVTVRRDDGRTFTKLLIPVLASGNYDVEIPENHVVVTVTTVTSNQETPVAASRVGYEVKAPPPADQQVAIGEQNTDQEGKAPLPPLPSGFLVAHVFAKGFRPAQSQPIEITEKTGDVEVPVRLTAGSQTLVHILSSTGSPAADAQIWTQSGGATADSSGTAVFEVPLPEGAPLVTFDTSGSMGFFRSSGDQEQTCRIPPSGPPIIVRFLSPDAKPLARKEVVVGVDGVFDLIRRSDQERAAGGDDAGSRADGTLRVAGIPAGGVLTIAPYGRLDLAITRTLPVQEEIVFTLPLEN